MAQVDSKKAKRKYKGKAAKDVAGRKEPGGTEAVVTLDELRNRLPELVALRIAQGQAAIAYQDAVKAVAKVCGLLSVTVNKVVRSRVSDSYLEDKAKADQLTFCFEELGSPLHDGDPKQAPAVQSVPDLAQQAEAVH